jgi:hypothetical protein
MKKPKNKKECLEMTIEALEQVIARKDKFINELLSSIERLNDQAEGVARSYLELEKENEILNAIILTMKEKKDFNDLIRQLEGL